MKYNILKCVVCKRPFEKRNKRKSSSSRYRIVRGFNAITCSSICSKERIALVNLYRQRIYRANRDIKKLSQPEIIKYKRVQE